MQMSVMEREHEGRWRAGAGGGCEAAGVLRERLVAAKEAKVALMAGKGK